MDKPKIFDFTMFKYRRPIILAILSQTRIGLYSPVSRLNKGSSKNLIPEITVLCKAIGFDSIKHKMAMTRHQNQYSKYRLITEIISTIFYILLAVLLLLSFIIVLALILGLFHIPSPLPRTLGYSFTQVIVYILMFISIYLALQVTDRITNALVDRHYADTLSFVGCLYLIIQISREETFINSEDRIIAIKRARALRRNIMLLSLQFDIINYVVLKHLESMINFTDDIEKQLILSTNKTQQKLLDSLNHFAKVLLTTHYGDFRNSNKAKAISKNPPLKQGSIFRSVVSLIIFIILIATNIILFLNPASFQTIGLNSNLVFLASFILILLIIDDRLNLGVVDKFLDVTRALRELR